MTANPQAAYRSPSADFTWFEPLPSWTGLARAGQAGQYSTVAKVPTSANPTVRYNRRARVLKSLTYSDW